MLQGQDRWGSLTKFRLLSKKNPAESASLSDLDIRIVASLPLLVGTAIMCTKLPKQLRRDPCPRIAQSPCEDNCLTFLDTSSIFGHGVDLLIGRAPKGAYSPKQRSRHLVEPTSQNPF